MWAWSAEIAGRGRVRGAEARGQEPAGWRVSALSVPTRAKPGWVWGGAGDRPALQAETECAPYRLRMTRLPLRGEAEVSGSPDSWPALLCSPAVVGLCFLTWECQAQY